MSKKNDTRQDDSLRQLVRLGDFVNWRTKNGRGNPCSRLASVYFRPHKGMVTLYVYGLRTLKRVPLSAVRVQKPNDQAETPKVGSSA